MFLKSSWLKFINWSEKILSGGFCKIKPTAHWSDKCDAKVTCPSHPITLTLGGTWYSVPFHLVPYFEVQGKSNGENGRDEVNKDGEKTWKIAKEKKIEKLGGKNMTSLEKQAKKLPKCFEESPYVQYWVSVNILCSEFNCDQPFWRLGEVTSK